MARSLVFALGCWLAACGGPSASATLPTVEPGQGPAPATDLGAAAANATPSTDATGGPRDPRLEVAPTKIYDLDTIRIQVTGHDATGDATLSVVAPHQLYDRAVADLAADRGTQAIATFRQLVDEFPDSKFAPLSLYQVANVYLQRGEVGAALGVLDELVTGYPDGREGLEAHLYLAAVQLEYQRFADGARTLETLAKRPDLTYVDQLEVQARLGYALVRLDRDADASAALEAAVVAWRKAPVVEDPYFIAMAHYYYGELLHRRLSKLPLDGADEAALAAQIDAHVALAAQAYDRWKAALQFKQAYWATAAGYQMSQILVDVWRIGVTAPYPPSMRIEARPAYVREVHARLRHLLDKALAGHETNVRLAEAFVVTTSWAEGSKVRAAEVLTLIADDAAGRYLTPR